MKNGISTYVSDVGLWGPFLSFEYGEGDLLKRYRVLGPFRLSLFSTVSDGGPSFSLVRSLKTCIQQQ